MAEAAAQWLFTGESSLPTTWELHFWTGQVQLLMPSLVGHLISTENCSPKLQGSRNSPDSAFWVVGTTGMSPQPSRTVEPHSNSAISTQLVYYLRTYSTLFLFHSVWECLLFLFHTAVGIIKTQLWKHFSSSKATYKSKIFLLNSPTYLNKCISWLWDLYSSGRQGRAGWVAQSATLGQYIMTRT